MSDAGTDFRQRTSVTSVTPVVRAVYEQQTRHAPPWRSQQRVADAVFGTGAKRHSTRRMKSTQPDDEACTASPVSRRWRISAKVAMLFGALGFVPGGCDFGCSAVLYYGVDPKVKTLRVGEAFAPNATA